MLEFTQWQHGKFDGDMFLGKKIFMGKWAALWSLGNYCRNLEISMPSGFFSAVFHYPQQRAFVYDRRTLKLLRADVKFPALTKSDYIRVIEGRIHLLAAAMVGEGRED